MQRSRRAAAFVVAVAVVVCLSGCFSVLHTLQRAVDPEDMRGIPSVPQATPTAHSTVRPEPPDVTIQAGSRNCPGVRSP